MIDNQVQMMEALRVAKRMRAEQTRFFQAPPGTPQRARAYHASRALEQQLDRLLDQLVPAPGDAHG